MSSGEAFHVLRSGGRCLLFAVDGSRVYEIDEATAGEFEQLSPEHISEILDLPPAWRQGAAASPATVPSIDCISLNVAQSCNLTCGYCYADAGRFGGTARFMTREVAAASIDDLLARSAPGARLTLGFMGGEPLLNADVVHFATRYASQAAQRYGRDLRFSITTNATLVRDADAELFRDHRFVVQISIDGTRADTDAARPARNPVSTYDRILEALARIERVGRPASVSARVTVTPRSGPLLPTLEHLGSLGFDDVGFAAVVVSPSPALAFGPDTLGRFLEEMKVCGRRALDARLQGRRLPFGNLDAALREIHRGTQRPYPCGAAAAYLSANADGDLYACHRLVDDPAFAMGNVRRGPDHDARARHLATHHVDQIEPCRRCWARYLCGGGCYHEVSRRGRIGCDYIRGWLEFCLGAYVEIVSVRPEYFDSRPPEETDAWSPTTIAD